MKWSRWKQFPHPKKFGILHAPIGPGVYEIRRRSVGRLVCFGIGGNCALRMTSLLPPEKGGRGTRNNSRKRAYIARHLADIEYRTHPTKTRQDAKVIEDGMRARASDYVFGT